MSIFSKNRSGFKELWLISFRLYRKSFLHVWPLVALFSAGLIISFAISAAYKFYNFESKIIGGVIPLILFLINIYLTSLLLLKIHEVGIDEKRSWKNLLTVVNKKFLNLTASMFIVVASYFLGLVSLILPGIFLVILFAMVQPLILFDDLGIISSIKGSCKLVWRNWWRTFGVIFPLLLISFWISYSIGYAVNEKEWSIVAFDLILCILLYPLFYACIITVFNDLKIRKELGTAEVKLVE